VDRADARKKEKKEKKKREKEKKLLRLVGCSHLTLPTWYIFSRIDRYIFILDYIERDQQH